MEELRSKIYLAMIEQETFIRKIEHTGENINNPTFGQPMNFWSNSMHQNGGFNSSLSSFGGGNILRAWEFLMCYRRALDSLPKHLKKFYVDVYCHKDDPFSFTSMTSEVFSNQPAVLQHIHNRLAQDGRSGLIDLETHLASEPYSVACNENSIKRPPWNDSSESSVNVCHSQNINTDIKQNQSSLKSIESNYEKSKKSAKVSPKMINNAKVDANVFNGTDPCVTEISSDNHFHAVNEINQDNLRFLNINGNEIVSVNDSSKTVTEHFESYENSNFHSLKNDVQITPLQNNDQSLKNENEKLSCLSHLHSTSSVPIARRRRTSSYSLLQSDYNVSVEDKKISKDALEDTSIDHKRRISSQPLINKNTEFSSKKRFSFSKKKVSSFSPLLEEKTTISEAQNPPIREIGKRRSTTNRRRNKSKITN